MTTQDKSRPRSGRRRRAADQDGAALAEETRGNILDEATKAFVAHGFEGASINEIAAATATSKRMIYYHFGSKQGLYTAVLEAAYERVGAQKIGTKQTSPTAMGALRAYAEDAFQKFHANEDFVRLVMAENLNKGATMRNSEGVRQRSAGNLSRLEEICKAGIAEGSMRDDFRILDLYFAVIGVAFHAVSNRISTGISLDMDLGAPDEIVFRKRLVGDVACRYAAKTDISE